MVDPWASGPTNKQFLPARLVFSPYLFEFQKPGLQRSQIFQTESQRVQTKSNKINYIKEDSLGPLMYSKALPVLK